MRDIIIEVTGRSELLMHNSRLANPMDPTAKAVREAHDEYKRLKTDEAFEELAHVEWLGSLYFHDEIGPYWPTDSLHACLKEAGAKVKKAGSRSSLKTAVAGALLLADEDTGINPLAYRNFKGSGPAPRDLQKLWDDGNYRDTRIVRVQSSRLPRTRPVFRNWSFEVPFALDTAILDWADLERVAVIAGSMLGLGDWRPGRGGRRGKFIARIIDKGESSLGVI